jgi:hypothetical protein
MTGSKNSPAHKEKTPTFMSIRFRKHVRLAPGIRLNLGWRGINSVSIGGRGLTPETISWRGIRSTVSLLMAATCIL